MFRKISRWEKGLFTASVLVRLVLLFLIVFYFGEATLYEFPGELSGRYIVFSESILSGKGFYEPAFDSLESKRTPGYSVYLLPFVGFDLPLWMASLPQIVLFSLIPIFAMRFMRKIGFGGRAELLAGFFTAFEPLQVFYSILLMPDAPTAMLFFIGVYFLVNYWTDRKYSYLIWSTIFLGFSNYLRPVILYWFFFIPLLLVFAWMLLRKDVWQGLKAGAVFGIIFLVLVLPWMFRNYYQLGVFGFSSGLGPYVLIYSGSGIIAAAEHVTFEEAQARIESEVTPLLPYPADFYSIKNSAVLSKKAKEVVLNHWDTFLRMYVFAWQTYFTSGNYHFILKHFGLLDQPSYGQVSITRLFASDGLSAVGQRLRVFVTEPYGLVAVMGRVLLGGIFLISLYGIYHSMRQHVSARFASMIYVLGIVYGSFSVVAGVEGIEARHRLFLNPLIFIFSSAGVTGIYAYFRSRQVSSPLVPDL